MVQMDARAAQPARSNKRPFLESSLEVRPWLAGVLVIAGLTFILGFHLPLLFAHEELEEQVKTLSLEYARAVAAFETTHAKLGAVERVSRDRKQSLDKISDAETSAESARTDLFSSVEQAVARQIDAKLMSVEQGDQGVVVTMESTYLIYPHKTFVHPPGAELLCQLARAFPKNASAPTRIVAHANGDKPASNILEKQFPTSWQLSSVLASEVAAALANCGVAGTDLEAVGAAHYLGDAKKGRKSAARFEIHIAPATPGEGAPASPP